MKTTTKKDFRKENKEYRKKQVRRAMETKINENKTETKFKSLLKTPALRLDIKDSNKSQKKRRRGRPRIEGKLREPNGRISRASNPPSLLALQARAFHNGLTLTQAKDPRAETYIGRLAIFGRSDGLSQDQYEAAQQFLQLRNDYRRTLLSPGAYYEATGIKLSQDNLAEYSAWVKRVQKRYKSALKAIQEAQIDNGHENLYAALQYVVIEGLELAYMIGALRLVLNALNRHFKSPLSKEHKSSWLDKHSISLAGMGVGNRTLH